MKKLLTILLLGIFLVSLVSALSFDNFKYQKDITFDGHSIIGNKLLEEYKPLQIKNAFGLGKTLFEGYISQHNNTCGINCLSTIEINLPEDGVLIEDIRFKTLQKDNSWIIQSVRNYQLSYLGRIDDYKTECINGKQIISPNGTISIPKICNQIKTGSHQGQIDYKLGEKLPKGIYTLKINAQKKPSRTVDWQIKTEGIWLDSWATWGSIAGGDQAEVILNSPADGSTTYTYLNQFNATANVTGGATLTNISLWTNETGSWIQYNTTFFPSEEGLVAYYTLNGSAGVVTDYTGNNDATISGGVTRGVAGKIDDSFTFDGIDGKADVTVFPNMTDGLVTACAWMKYTDNNAGKVVLGQWEGSPPNIQAWAIAFDAQGKLEFIVYDGIGQKTALSTANYNDTTWHFVCGRANSTQVSLFVDNVEIHNQNYDGTIQSTNTQFSIGAPFTGSGYYTGGFDEISIWNKSLSNDEITSLYNLGNGRFPPESLTITSTQTWDRTIIDGIIWNVQACDSDGDCGFATSNYSLNLDNSINIDVESPEGTLDYGVIGKNETLNVTFNSVNLDKCWYDYNGTNVSIDGCVSEVKNSTTFNLEKDNYDMTLWANDTVGNLNSTTISWDYRVLENNRTFNSTTYETAYEGYEINLTANSSLTSVYLDYNGSSYSMTNAGSGIWSYSRDLPTSTLGNNNVRFKFDYVGNTIYSTNSTQTVNPIVFTQCNSTYSTKFLNISFKDEADLTYINASIESSTWDYYLGTGSQTKSYIFSNNTENYNYGFCASPNETLNLDISMNYLASTYPTRIWEPNTLSLTNSTTNKILYLLSENDGIYSTFITVSSLNTILSGTSIVITRDISGSDVTVAQGTTDSAGSSTFWLNPNYDHLITASKTGYGISIQTLRPTQSTYTLTLQSTTNYSYVSNTRGLLWGIFPRIGITNATSQNFGFNVSAVYGNLVKCKIELLNKDKSITLSSNEYITSNSSLCSVYTTYTINNTYPQIKGRLLVDMGEGYQILEEDAFWVVLEVDSTGMTIKDWLGNLKSFDLKYFAGGSNEVKQQHREYTQILLFFLVLTIICAALNMTGWDIQTNGGMIFLIGFFVWIASFAGFLNLAYISPFAFIDKYFVALIYSMFMIGFATRSFS